MCLRFLVGKFLSIVQRHELLEEHRREDNKKYADRIKTVLLFDNGWSAAQIAEALFIDESTARRYRKAYDEGGIEQLILDNYIGGSTKLTIEQEEELGQHLQSIIYLSTKDIVEYVSDTYGIKFSVSGMRDLLHRLNFTYKKPKVVPGKANLEMQMAFMLWLHQIKADLGQNDKLFFVDGTHPQHNSMPAYGWIKKGEQKELKTNSARQRLNLLGALDTNNLNCLVRNYETLDGSSTISFFKDLEKRNVAAKKLYLVVDGGRYFHCQEVDEYLKTSKIKLIQLPPYSPNLNLIERLWKFFHKKVLYNEYYEKFQDFTDSSLEFFKNLKSYKSELKTILTEKVEFIGA